MGRRVNTAAWDKKSQRWKINVQKDGKRRSVYSSIPGREGQREANAKADAWLDNNISNSGARIANLFEEYIEDLKLRTSKSNWRAIESRSRLWILPEIGHMKISAVNDQYLQNIINKAFAQGELSKKSLEHLRAIMVSFIKFCRKKKCTTCHPEEIIIPKSATVGQRRILQPEHIVTLFSVDTTLKYGKRIHDPYINAYRFQVLTGVRPG